MCWKPISNRQTESQILYSPLSGKVGDNDETTVHDNLVTYTIYDQWFTKNTDRLLLVINVTSTHYITNK